MLGLRKATSTFAPRGRGLAHHAPMGTSFEPAVIGARLALNPIADKQVRLPRSPAI